MSDESLTMESPMDKLQKAGCIVAFVADAFLAKDDPVTGETLKVACDLIYTAMDAL